MRVFLILTGLLFSVFILSGFTYGQGEGNFWYFGNNAGIDFNSGSPIALTNGVLTTTEGCASISDAAGNLLFYTDGIRVYNSNHAMMANGNGLMGDPSSSQSGIIVKDPGNNDRYYIVTVGASGTGDCAYSAVDMTLNGGLGDVEVATKNILLQNTVSEKVTAVPHNNGSDFWIIAQAHGTSNYYAYLITATGVNPTPVISDPGGIIQAGGGMASIGYLKANHAGDKLAAAIHEFDLIEIYDFNNSTGVLTNAITFPSVYNWAYGVEFSPDDNILYFTSYSPGNVYQVDMTAGSAANIIASTTLLAASNNSFPSALQIANDGKMYIAKYSSPFLAVINNPNVWGAGCGFVDDGFNLGGMSCQLGLPNFLPNLFTTYDFTFINLCYGDSTLFNIVDTINLDSVYWDFDDPTSGIYNNSDLFSPYHIFTDSGTYDVQLITYESGNIDTVSQQVTILPLPNIDLGPDTSICNGSNIVLDAGVGYASYLWSTNDVSQTIIVSASGLYAVTVSDANGCIGSDEINITLSTAIPPTITGSLSFCSGASTTLDAGGGYTNYLWSTTDVTQTIAVVTAGTYVVTVTDSNSCTGTDQVNVIENVSPVPIISGVLSFCSGASTVLDAGSGYTSYLWSTSDTTQNITITNGGIYSVTVTDLNGCTGVNQVSVTENINPVPDISGLLSFCSGTSTTLDAGSGFTTYLWNTNEFTQTILVTSAGAYSVTVEDANGCTGSDQVNVLENTNPLPSISGSLSFCTGNSSTLNAGTGYSSYEWSQSGSTQIITITSGGSYSVTVTDLNGCTGTDQVNVLENNGPSPSISGLLSFCTGTTTTLDAGAGYTEYLWFPTGSTAQSIIVATPGTYVVTVTDDNGCTGSDGVNVTEEPISITASPDQFICYGTATNITVNVGNGASPFNYYWSTGETTSVISVSPTTQTTYSVSVVDSKGCTSNIESVVISVTTPVEVNLYANSDYICPGDEVVINTIINNGMPPYYIYDQHGNIIVPPLIVSLEDTTDYIFTVEDLCESKATDTITIYTYPLPDVGISSDSVFGCEPFTVEFNSLFVAQSYVWDFGDDDNLSFSNDPSHTYNNNGVYNVTLTVTSDKGCSNSITEINMITVYNKPNAKFIYDPEVASIIKPIVNFSNYSSGHVISYWDFGDNAESNMENPSHVYPAYPAGTHIVMLVTESINGCKDTAYNDVIIANEYTFFAPTAFSPDFDGINDEFQVFGHGIDPNNFNLYIYDRWGELIFEGNDIKEGWDGRVKGKDIGKSGSYTWLCIYNDLNGIEHQESGAVTIIK